MASLRASLPREVGDCVRLIYSTTLLLSSLSADWAHFSAKLCGAKAHVVYDPDADCPVFFGVTPARMTDIAAAKAMPVEPGCTYVFDIGYYDYGWWAAFDKAGCRIVTRLQSNTLRRVVQRLPLPQGEHNILSDTIGFLPARQARSRRNPRHPQFGRLLRANILHRIPIGQMNRHDPPNHPLAHSAFQRTTSTPMKHTQRTGQPWTGSWVYPPTAHPPAPSPPLSRRS